MLFFKGFLNVQMYKHKPAFLKSCRLCPNLGIKKLLPLPHLGLRDMPQLL